MPVRYSIALLALLAASPARSDEPQQNASFYVINKGSVAIDRLFATPVGLSNWGQDRLTSSSIPPGSNFAVRLPADGTCSYDIKVTYSNGRSEEKRGVNACAIENLTFPGGRSTTAQNRGGGGGSEAAVPSGHTFTVVNRSRGVLNEIYLSSSDSDSWGDDRLGDDTLSAGASKPVRLAGSECRYDIRVVFADGDAYEKRRLDICRLGSIRFP